MILKVIVKIIMDREFYVWSQANCKQNNSKKAGAGEAEEAKEIEYQKGKVFIAFQHLLKWIQVTNSAQNIILPPIRLDSLWKIWFSNEISRLQFFDWKF